MNWLNALLQELINWITPQPKITPPAAPVVTPAPPFASAPAPTVPIPVITAPAGPVIQYPDPTETAVVNAIITKHVITLDEGNSHFEAPSAADIVAMTEMFIDLSSSNNIMLDFFLAVICQESLFCYICWDLNLAAGQAAASATFGQTDWGIAQVSGDQVPTQPGMSGLTQAEMKAKVLTYQWSLPNAAQWYDTLLTWAEETVKVTALMNPKIPEARNIYWLATLAYNRGQQGALDAIASGSIPDHPYEVSEKCNGFAADLGMSALMPTTYTNPTDGGS